MDIKKILGKRVQTLRRSKGFTQDKLAEIIGIDTISLSKIETGRNYPTAENLSRIAEILEVYPYELFIGEQVKSNKELLEEINLGMQKISKDNKKLHILYTTLRSLTD